jgi:hypothetical protein
MAKNRNTRPAAVPETKAKTKVETKGENTNTGPDTASQSIGGDNTETNQESPDSVMDTQEISNDEVANLGDATFSVDANADQPTEQELELIRIENERAETEHRLATKMAENDEYRNNQQAQAFARSTAMVGTDINFVIPNLGDAVPEETEAEAEVVEEVVSEPPLFEVYTKVILGFESEDRVAVWQHFCLNRSGMREFILYSPTDDLLPALLVEELNAELAEAVLEPLQEGADA